MIKYFSNPELKKSSLFMIVLVFITLISSYWVVNLSYERMKINYTESNMAIVGEINKVHPELTKEIIPLITKERDKSKVEAGRNILKKYGYDEKLQIKFIPTMEQSYNITLKGIIICLIVFFIIMFVENYIQYAVIYKRLERIILVSENIVECNFDIGIYENVEGTFAKLSHAFNNMRIIMKNNFSTMQKEKKFLVDLLSDISHQLKTPIASLIIYNDILLNRNLNEEKRKEFLENSGKQLNRIEWLVKSLLKLAKLDAGVIKFENQNRDINETVKEAIEALKLKAEHEKVQLVFNTKQSQIIMPHDSNWIGESIINLIKNSLEHTNEGGVVEVFTEKTSVSIRIIVKDNGDGISKEEIPHIFKRFFKGKKNKNSESVGIGLALSKSIIEAHDGLIEVKSKKDEGTTFNITFLSY